MTYKSLLVPRAHQITARKHMIKTASLRYGDVFALLMDMGTGKSKVIVDEFGERADANDVSDLLLFAPAGCYANWFADRGDLDPSEFKKHMDPEFFERLVFAPWISGGNKGSKIRIENVLKERDRPRALIVNIEALSTVATAREAIEEFVATSRHGVIVAIDESTTIKEKKASRTRVLTQIGLLDNIAAKRIMSGLVSPNSPLDLFAQFNFLDWRILGFQTFVGFRARYAYLRDYKHTFFDKRSMREREITTKIVSGFKNIEEIHGKIDSWSYRVLKEDCLDLPEKEYVSRDVELTDDQRRHYNELKEFATSQLAEEAYVTATMVLALRTRLDQVLCGFTVDETGHLHEIKERRTDALVEFLSDFNGKAIIWTTHDYSIHKITKRLREEFGPRSAAQFWGGNRSIRHLEEARFKGDPDCRFIVATQSAGGRGNTWVQGGVSCYYNNSDNLEHRMQSEDRTHREGLMGPTGAGFALYCDFIARGTIDDNKVKNLRKKLDLATLVTGENYRSWLI